MSDYRGRFVWYELLTPDPQAAVAFYTQVVGWGTMLFTDLGTPYTMWTRGETPIGGVMELPAAERQAGARPHWLAYIGTPEVDATFGDAKKLGAGTLVAPTDVPTVGRFAVLSDPQGATFAAFTPASAPADQEGPPALGDFSWHELATSDHAAAFQFYSTLFGWRKTDAFDMGPGGLYQMYGRAAGVPLGGMFNQPADAPAPPHWLLYARVPDVSKGAQAVRKLGGKVLKGPMEVPGGDWIVECQDPQGAAFALHRSVAG